MSTCRYVKEWPTSPRILTSGGDLSGTVTSSTFNCSGANHLVLLCDYTNDSATAIAMTMEYKIPGTSVWCPVPEEDVSSPPTITGADASWSRTVAANDEWVWNIPVAYNDCRLKFTSTSGTSSDTVTVYGRLQVR